LCTDDCDDCRLRGPGGEGIFEEEVGLEVEEGRGIVLQFPEEVVAACLLGFSCVLQG